MTTKKKTAPERQTFAQRKAGARLVAAGKKKPATKAKKAKPATGTLRNTDLNVARAHALGLINKHADAGSTGPVWTRIPYGNDIHQTRGLLMIMILIDAGWMVAARETGPDRPEYYDGKPFPAEGWLRVSISSRVDRSTNWAKERIKQLENGIRAHRDEKGHGRCWLDDLDLYKLLPEGEKGGR